MRTALLGSLGGWGAFAVVASASSSALSGAVLAVALLLSALALAHVIAFALHRSRSAAAAAIAEGDELSRRRLFAVGGAAALVATSLALGRPAAAEAARRLKLDLGCECDKIPVGVGLVEGYATKAECEEKGIPAAYDEAVAQASGFCTKWYRCIDPECPVKIFVNETTTKRCYCSERRDGTWYAFCDLSWRTKCCCVPRGRPD